MGRIKEEKTEEKEKDKTKKKEDENMGRQRPHIRTSKKGRRFVAGRKKDKREKYYSRLIRW